MLRTALALNAAVGLRFTACVDAHDYWFEADGDDYLLDRGQRYSEHQGEAGVPYDPAIVERAGCLTGNGHAAAVTPSQSYPVRIPGPCTAVFVEADSGHWMQALPGARNQPRDQVVGALRSWQSLEGVKRMEPWSAALSGLISDGLDLVTAVDPFQLKRNDKLRLLVTWKGQPRSGVAVAHDGAAGGVSGKDEG